MKLLALGLALAAAALVGWYAAQAWEDWRQLSLAAWGPPVKRSGLWL